MPVLPLLRPREVVCAFERLSWRVARQRGSHIVLTRPGASVTLSIPDHAQVARGTLRALIVKAGITIEEFRRGDSIAYEFPQARLQGGAKGTLLLFLDGSSPCLTTPETLHTIGSYYSGPFWRCLPMIATLRSTGAILALAWMALGARPRRPPPPRNPGPSPSPTAS